MARRWAREPRPYEWVAWAAVRGRAGRPGGRPLRKRILWCVGEGLCPSRGRGRTPPLRKGCKRCGTKRNPPVTALPCQPPLGKGAEGTGVRIATAGVRTGFAMTWFFARGAVRGRAGDRKGRPYGGLQGVQWLSDGRGRTPPLRKRYKGYGGADGAGPRPYGDVYVFFSAHRKTPGMAPAFQVWVLRACGAARHHLYYM